LIYALPPLKDLRVADLGAGTGRSAQALLAAYPSIHLTLIEPDEVRGWWWMVQKMASCMGGFTIQYVNFMEY
jgi:predicted RNA methylase